MKKSVLGALFLTGMGFSICAQAASPASKEYVDRLHQELQAQITPTYTVGQQAQGGTVFYTNSAGTHGLVVANTDQATEGSKNWYEASNIVTAPQYYDSAGAFYSDWFVPSAAQLQTLCSAVPLVPALSSTNYWSSTSGGLENVIAFEEALTAFVFDMSNCPGPLYAQREPAITPHAVRAIRSF